MTDIKILSYNCRGLNDCKKRNDVFNFLKTKFKAHIYCLQDCHFTPSLEKQIYSQWDGECYFSHGNSNSRGVCILFQKNIPVTIHAIKKDQSGNLLK